MCIRDSIRVSIVFLRIVTELGDRIYLNPQKYYGNPDEGWELADE